MRRAIPLGLALVALAGCGSSGGVNPGKFKGDAKAVASSLSDLSDAARKGDGQRACAELLSRRLVDALEAKGGCRKAMDGQFDDADVFKLDVRSIDVRGDRATAVVKSEVNGDSRAATLGLVRESRRWRVDSLGG